MQSIILKIQDSEYETLLTFLKTLSYVTVETLPTEPTLVYDFSNVTGKLQWTGDALAEQQKLRNEWNYEIPTRH